MQYFIAFLEGLITFISPCLLPMLPVYISYFAGGGQQFVTCVVSHEELLDAQIHPEKHQDLIVRVGGYSDYFVNISKALQDNVIARTYQEI